MSAGTQTSGRSPAGDRRQRRIGIFMATSCAVLWGFLAIAMKIAVAEVDAFTIVWFRFAFAFGSLALVMGIRRPESLAILVRPPLLAWVAALALTGNYVGFLTGLSMTSPSFSQVLIQIAPLMLAMVGVAYFGERLSRFQLGGALLALGGFVLFYYDQYKVGVVEHETMARGVQILAAAAVAWTLYAALQKVIVARGTSPQRLNLVLYCVPALLLLPLAKFGALASLTPGMWALMLFLGANTLLAYGALGEALSRLPAFQVSLILTCNPLITLAAIACGRWLGLEWVPEDEVSVVGYGAALLVVLGIAGVLKRPATRS
ncbi:MAG: drug/metabolite transporter (DMT)-like permease [Candidatus Paceibacteria bacterium]|jgi:drug/metabolite transporter (DMT)-like permease